MLTANATNTNNMNSCSTTRRQQQQLCYVVDYLQSAEDITNASGIYDFLEPTPIGPCGVERVVPEIASFGRCMSSNKEESQEIADLFAKAATHFSTLPAVTTTSTIFHPERDVHSISESSSSFSSSSAENDAEDEDSTAALFMNDPTLDEFDELLARMPLFEPTTITTNTTTMVPSPVVPSSQPQQHLLHTTSKLSNIKPAKAKRTRKYQTGQWNERYQELLQFRVQHGHMFVPHSYKKNCKLAQWVKR
jgi:hypothetical protein